MQGGGPGVERTPEHRARGAVSGATPPPDPEGHERMAKPPYAGGPVPCRRYLACPASITPGTSLPALASTA